MARAYFHECAFNLRGRQGGLIKKPWAVSTTDLRLIRSIQNAMVSMSMKRGHRRQTLPKTAFYMRDMAETIIESLYPQKFYHSVPSIQASALATKNPKKSERANHPEALAAVKKEAEDLRKKPKLGMAKSITTTVSNLKLQTKKMSGE